MVKVYEVGDSRQLFTIQSISKLLVERLGGEIGYEPAPGGGARFWFELPVAPPVAAPGAAA